MTVVATFSRPVMNTPSPRVSESGVRPPAKLVTVKVPSPLSPAVMDAVTLPVGGRSPSMSLQTA